MIESVRFYELEKPGLGRRLVAAVEEATLFALAFPMAGTPIQQGVRRVLVRDFPFAIMYRPSGEGITVFAIAHTSRKPG
ncbi:MAG: type II toxin-antitoxin system RelE/ParE family toxin, partial [Trueperaceae bacterium]|nr:type II toxin-antitoxin system RelE/ParE family toxin [Trueperaceae bacterium]